MSGNLSLLTVLFIMCYFIKKGGNYAVTTITRAHEDYFTDVCQNCIKYGATTVPQRGICECKLSAAVFLPDHRECKNGQKFMTDEHCKIWQTRFVEVIDTEETNSYPFIKEIGYSSYQLEPLISYRNSTTGEWQFFNLSGNVLMLQNVSDPMNTGRLLQIKVTQVSPNLTQFKGYVMKLGLKRIHDSDGRTSKSCLLFKAKGKIHFPLKCIPTTPVSTTTTGIPTATPVSTTTTGIPTTTPVSTTTTGIPTTTPVSTTTTGIPTTTTGIPTTTPVSTTGIPTTMTSSTQTSTVKPTTTPQPGIIAAIVTGGTALVLMSLICTVLVVHRYTYMCRPRALQARNLDHDVDVIRNPGPQTYRIPEEPVYAEVSDIFPCGKGSAGSPTNEWEENATVLLNLNVYEARFSVQTPTTDPLPSRPELAGNTNTQFDARAVYQNSKKEAIAGGAEDSIVFKNPEAGASFSSLPGSENDFTKLSEAHEPEGQSIGDHQHHVEDDTDNSTVHNESEGTSDDHYQRLVQGKRPHSVFICPSCNDNPVYQRLSVPHSCPHGAKDKQKEPRASVYESLQGLQQGSQEPDYARPPQITGEPAAEDKGNRNSEEGEGQPEYHTLEQEETGDENCQLWEKNFVEVIDTEKTNSYLFTKGATYSSYQLEPVISYRNSTTGEWQFFNLSGNVLVLQNGSDRGQLLQIKVTQVSPDLTQFKGYVMKLGLKRKRLDGNTEKSCLLFKAKGEIHFPLECSTHVVSTTSTPSTTTSAITRTLVTSPTASSPSIIVRPTITCTACTATSSIPTTPTTPTTPKKPDPPLPPGIIAAIVIGAVLCLSVIFTLVVMYRYRYICKTRRLQARNLDHDFDVIRNPGPQTYRIQEEPLYVEVPDILPCGKGSAGGSTNECEDNATVILNPANVYEVQFLVQRRTTAPLPSRPELARNTNTQVEAGAVYQNDESEAIGERAENSIVFKNPEVEASSSSLSRSECEPEGQSIADHQHHVEDDVDNSTVHNESEGTSDDHYQRLVQGKRPRSVFICQSCNDNPVYQRLSMPHSCPHGAKDKLKLKENRASYESLSGLGSQESVYERPSQTTGEPAAEDKGNMNSEEGDGQPEYHTLEQEETAVSNEEDLTKPVNHDYNVLEGPGETGDEVDERAKDSISRDPDQTSEDSDSSLEPSKILNMEDNPAYAKPWKTKEDPDLPLEPSDILNIEHNPLYSTPLKAKTAEPCSRRRAYSM